MVFQLARLVATLGFVGEALDHPVSDRLTIFRVAIDPARSWFTSEQLSLGGTPQRHGVDHQFFPLGVEDDQFEQVARAARADDQVPRQGRRQALPKRPRAPKRARCPRRRPRGVERNCGPPHGISVLRKSLGRAHPQPTCDGLVS